MLCVLFICITFSSIYFLFYFHFCLSTFSLPCLQQKKNGLNLVYLHYFSTLIVFLVLIIFPPFSFPVSTFYTSTLTSLFSSTHFYLIFLPLLYLSLLQSLLLSFFITLHISCLTSIFSSAFPPSFTFPPISLTHFISFSVPLSLPPFHPFLFSSHYYFPSLISYPTFLHFSVSFHHSLSSVLFFLPFSLSLQAVMWLKQQCASTNPSQKLASPTYRSPAARPGNLQHHPTPLSQHSTRAPLRHAYQSFNGAEGEGAT